MKRDERSVHDEHSTSTPPDVEAVIARLTRAVDARDQDYAEIQADRVRLYGAPGDPDQRNEDLRAILTAFRSLTLRAGELEREREALLTAMSWLDDPFVDETTPPSEVMTRIKLMRADRARALINQTKEGGTG